MTEAEIVLNIYKDHKSTHQPNDTAMTEEEPKPSQLTPFTDELKGPYVLTLKTRPENANSMMEANRNYNECCLMTMARMPSGFVDLTITSPPYDDLRDYKGYSFPFEEIAKELFRVTKPGGVVVWVVGDKIVDGDKIWNFLQTGSAL